MITCSEEDYPEPPPMPPKRRVTDEIRIDWISAVDKQGRHWPILLRSGFEMPPELLHPDFVSASTALEQGPPA